MDAAELVRTRPALFAERTIRIAVRPADERARIVAVVGTALRSDD